MVAMNLNANTYVLSSSATAATITLTDDDANQQSIVLYNGDSTNVCYVKSNKTNGTIVAAAVPTSATVPLALTAVGPGQTLAWTKNIGDDLISAVWSSGGTGKLHVKVGQGN